MRAATLVKPGLQPWQQCFQGRHANDTVSCLLIQLKKQHSF
ncbi:hypothetical protein SynMITS9220_00993 [Synechococcus sp. MIT S9220]|nr:hypothetical protein SynMITS9220_00993 [Synechococcus sp. MIT S9220]